jgi:hypothetical protein
MAPVASSSTKSEHLVTDLALCSKTDKFTVLNKAGNMAKWHKIEDMHILQKPGDYNAVIFRHAYPAFLFKFFH